MRQLSHKNCVLRINSEFPIPMRGNEESYYRPSAPVGPAVPDPYEG